MDFMLVTILLFSLVAWLSILQASKRRHPKHKLPPGPKPLPLIGNILALGSKVHLSLTRLVQTYGPVMFLKLGSLDSVVISSPEAAKAIYQQHDQVFCDRRLPKVMSAFDHNRYSVACIPMGSQWRKLRKICKEKMFSMQKLNSSHDLRMGKLQDLMKHVDECSRDGQVVDIGRLTFTTTLNLISTSLFSIDVVKGYYDSNSGQEFKDIIMETMRLMGKPNIADFFSIFQNIDPQGILRENVRCLQKLFVLFDETIRQRIEMKRSAANDYIAKNDMLEALLEDETSLSFDDIRHLAMDLFTAGSDTTSGTVEWAMAELIRHPEKMAKLKNELKSISNPNQLIQESEISKLPYLQAIVKETFRLYPAAPLSVPRQAKEDTQIFGYTIPKNAQIIVNIWAIGRDSSTWSNPEQFMPERFMDMNVDFRGQHFELIPFGGGRRICPGLPLAQRMIHLMLANLVKDYKWTLEDGRMKCEELDMEAKPGLILHKAMPLKVIPVKD